MHAKSSVKSISCSFYADNWIREIGKFGALNSTIAVVGNKADLRSNVSLPSWLRNFSVFVDNCDSGMSSIVYKEVGPNQLGFFFVISMSSFLLHIFSFL